MSHHTQHTDTIKAMRDKQKTYLCTLQKVSGDLSIYSDLYTGHCYALPEVGGSFRMTVKKDINYNWFQTSTVVEITTTPESTIIKTLNSTYELKLIDE